MSEIRALDRDRSSDPGRAGLEQKLVDDSFSILRQAHLAGDEVAVAISEIPSLD